MAALLVALSVMAVLMTVAMPVWKTTTQREKEAELIFRGEQYARAIGLFQRKFANAFPPNVDLLVEQRFLRKKYKDPITNSDFVPILQGQATSATPTGGGRGTAAPGQTAPPGGRGFGGAGTNPTPAPGSTPGGTVGGLAGVTSKSKDTSLRLYKGRSHYNEWAFVYVPAVQAPGAGQDPAGGPGGRGGPGRGRGDTGPGGGRSPFGPGRGGNDGGPGGPGGPGRAGSPFGQFPPPPGGRGPGR